jgi:hypothetical protein
MSFLDSVKSIITDTIVDKLSDTIGVDSAKVKSAITLFIPGVIAGVINKGSDAKGAAGLLDSFQSEGFGDVNTGDILSVLGNQTETNNLLETGRELLGTIFGNSQTNVLNHLNKNTNLGKSESTGLFGFLAPMVMNKLAGLASDRNMDASGLSSYLIEQKPEIQSLVPGIFSMFSATNKTQKSSNDTENQTLDPDTASSGGNGFLKWFIPLFLGAALIWILAKNGCSSPNDTSTGTDDIENQEQDRSSRSQETTSENENRLNNRNQIDLSNVNLSAISFNEKNDIIGDKGTVLIPSGSFEMDEAGNLIGPGDRILIEASKMPDAFKNKLVSVIDEIRKERSK